MGPERMHGVVILAPYQYNTCHNDTQHNNTEYHSSGCLYTECDIVVPVWVSFYWASLSWVLYCYSYAASHSFWVSLFCIVHCYSYAECHSFWVSLFWIVHCYSYAEFFWVSLWWMLHCCSCLTVILLGVFMLSVALLFLCPVLHSYSYTECYYFVSLYAECCIVILILNVALLFLCWVSFFWVSLRWVPFFLVSLYWLSWRHCPTSLWFNG